ncbi:MAG: hypothetical protein N2047_09030, partial [Meiothermus sp.]|nr:hypothetical protein [Meiothermus sp.]
MLWRRPEPEARPPEPRPTVVVQTDTQGQTAPARPLAEEPPSLQPDLTTSDPRALIGAVRVRVAVRYANGVWASRQAEVYARGIPR